VVAVLVLHINQIHDHERYDSRGQAYAEDVAHLVAGDTARARSALTRSWLVRLSPSLYSGASLAGIEILFHVAVNRPGVD
jgi:hypothetical protein